MLHGRISPPLFTIVRFYFHVAKQVFPIMHPMIIAGTW